MSQSHASEACRAHPSAVVSQPKAKILRPRYTEEAQRKFREFDQLPDAAEVRQPTVEQLFSISPSTLARRVRQGLIPKPIVRGRTISWRVGELRQALAASNDAEG